jgi:hypothetical protein
MSIGAHSLNPYFPAWLNPLDLISSPTVSHQLHHALGKSHYYGIPFHHFVPGGFQKDLELYDSIFNTAISGTEGAQKQKQTKVK